MDPAELDNKDVVLGVDQLGGLPPLNNGEFQELRIILNRTNRHTMATAVTFDTHSQLFWCGSETGHVTSYYGPNFMKYTAFQAHHDVVHQILPDAHGVLSLCPNDVRYTTKEGLKIFSAGSDNMHSMRTMVRGSSSEGVPQDNNVLMAGQNEHFFELDLTTGCVTEKPNVLCDPSVVVMKKQQHGYLCCGQQSGEVLLYDPDTLKACHTLEAHSSAISDFDVHNNLLVTCGFTERYGHLSVDPYLLVYDIRTLRPFPTVQVPVDPVFVKFIPTYTLRCLVVSQSGQFVLAQPDSIVVDPGIYQLNNQGQPIMDCCVSETYQSFGFGDSVGFVHIWSDRDETQLLFNHGDRPCVLPDEVPHLDAFDIDDWSIPLTDIPMPYTTEPLLSDWPDHLLKRADRPTPPIDPDILKNMTIRQFVGYAPNPKKRLRNQVSYDLKLDMNGDYNRSPDSPLSRESSLVPKMYRKVDIKYSKYGVEDFNFRHYNQTKFSGLEIHIPNAYCNSMLQVLYFIDVLRVGLRNHLCEREFCVACELGFLFYMLDTSEGQTCQASNFLRTFRTLPEASALGLLINDQDQGRKNKSISHTIQNWNRFVLRQLHQDTKENREDKNASFKDESREDKNASFKEEKQDTVFEDLEINGDLEDEEEQDTINGSTPERKDAPKEPPKEASKESSFESPSLIKDLFGMDVLSCRTCKCGAVHERKVTIFGTDLAYPDRKEDGDTVYPFTRLLQESIMRKQTTQAWCDKCQKYQTSGQLRKIISLPDVLAINCQLDHTKDIEFWKKQQELAEPYNQVPNPLHASPPKLCRYGKFCNRPGCKFTHQGREQNQMLKSQTSEEFQMSMNTWIPTMFEATHNLDTLEVNLSVCQNKVEKEGERQGADKNKEYSQDKIVKDIMKDEVISITEKEKGGEMGKVEEKAEGEEGVLKSGTVEGIGKEDMEGKTEMHRDPAVKAPEKVDQNETNETFSKGESELKEEERECQHDGDKLLRNGVGALTEDCEDSFIANDEDTDSDVLAVLAEKTAYPRYVYKLMSNVCHINDVSSGSTLVSHIHVGTDYHERKNDIGKEEWYVFNDFAITPISETDAVTFNMEWKVPSVLVYVRQDIEGKYATDVELNMDSSILFCDKSLASRQSRFSRNFSPLNSTEVLKEGDIVGVDAEFVTLNQEESEMRRDGTMSTLRPSQMSVARITVVRGWGPLQGVPFIDDYISTSEQVVDYLTKFSGIKPGDLDASISSKHLTTLKTSYLKLRYLIDAKVLFIGHGLKKDFRVINLVIPRDQVVDTVELFHLPKQRFVSLKFLAWHFLNINIQADTHDSAEDAYTALKLYEKYRELLRAGEWVLEEELEILYETGRQYNWQVPE